MLPQPDAAKMDKNESGICQDDHKDLRNQNEVNLFFKKLKPQYVFVDAAKVC